MKIVKESADFTVQDQLHMDISVNYNRWLFDLLSPWLNGFVLEVGSGNGNITQFILSESTQVKSLTCLDINSNCCDYLTSRISHIQKEIQVKIINSDFMDIKDAKYDCIFSFNVLEHIKDDLGALKKMRDLLFPKGKLLCFVPAFKILYGTIDEKLHHYRRYSKKQLANRINLCGFKVIKLRYYNTVGFFGWFFNNRIFKIQSQKRKQILLFDKYIFPVQSYIESVINVPFGQSLFCIAEKNK